MPARRCGNRETSDSRTLPGSATSFPEGCLTLLALLVILQGVSFADFSPAKISVKDETYWVGQRVPFLVELRAAGSFSGAASFSLPEIPRVVIIKVGNPVVSSEEDKGESVFVQTHEFALFSQQSGTVEIPSFEVRFSHKDGFTGPSKDQSAEVPATKVSIKRPPGSDENQFLVTTASFALTESWDPQPGSTKLGNVFQRTITQQADQISGMALAPPPEAVPDGIRIYLNPPEVTDDTERGSFRGNRTDKITYVMQKPGAWTLPAITYVWWDPAGKKFGSKKLPSVAFKVPAPPIPETDERPSEQSSRWEIWLIAGLVFVALAVWQRRRVIHCGRQAWRSWNPPERVAARKLLRACHRNDAKAAEAAWLKWQNWQPAGFQPTPSLRAAAIDLQSCLYGRQTPSAWRGTELAQAFREQRAEDSSSHPSGTDRLPQLNLH